MSRYWEYPIYLIPHGGGYASMVDPQSENEDDPTHMLVVYTQSEVAVQFMSEFGIPEVPRMLFNDREFGWMLQSLKSPVRQVAFDPSPLGDKIAAQWQVAIQELIDDHLTTDYSPWNYPVFAIAQDGGFVSLLGAEDNGKPTIAIGLFTSEEKANGYLEGADEEGELCELTNLDDTRTFLEALSDQVGSVAVNPIAEQDNRTATHCFSLPILLEKYLVRED